MAPTQRCPRADTNTCGCGVRAQSDYTGFVDATWDGKVCERWDAKWIVDAFGFEPKEEYPDAGLDSAGGSFARQGVHNFCRNPTYDPMGAYCLTKSSFLPVTADMEPFDEGELDEKEEESGSASAVESSNTTDGQGRLRRLNSYHDSNRTTTNRTTTSTMAGATVESCNVPTCDACSCMPPCGAPNLEPCACPSFFQSEECCIVDASTGAEDLDCKCGYLKEACRKSLENGNTIFCDDAEVACCESGNGVGDADSCMCDFYEQMCEEFPFPGTCDYAADRCCGSRDFVDQADNANVMWANSQCLCDFYTHAATFLGPRANTQEDRCDVSEDFNCHCTVAADYRMTAPMAERIALESLYEGTRGYYWTDKTGWLDDNVPHCEWFGLTCNEAGLVTEIQLPDNNLEGGLPAGSVDSFAGLTKLDLSQNKLRGSLNATDFHKMRNLTHVDVSRNQFDGHADLYFGPATTHIDYSWNGFTSAGFKKFNTAYSTMQKVDLSHNLLEMPAADLFRNIPLSVSELKLSNNTLRGELPNPFPNLQNLTYFEIANNAIEGGIPYFRDLAHSKIMNNATEGGISIGAGLFQGLTVLDLSGNKLSQRIPPEMGYFSKLKVLNLTGNALDGPIPESLGKLEGVIEILDLSNNKLIDRIPAELGRLQETILLLGSNYFTPPAPLSVCKIPTVKEDEDLCPAEVKILEDFYNIFNGQNWTNKQFWLDEAVSYCLWYGVVCDEFGVSVTKLELSNNGLSGELSTEIIERMSGLGLIEVLDLSTNDIEGTIPAEIKLLENLVELDLSNQKQGLTGAIPEDLSKITLLSSLSLADNKLDQSIPSSIGFLQYLKELDLSSNDLSQLIPSQLGKLDAIEMLDMSNNNLDGTIPIQLGELEEAKVYLTQNELLLDPAPLSLCISGNSDITNDARMCPKERNVLREFYISSKGNEWTESNWWLDEYESHCNWLGVTCNDEDKITELELTTNGLSGTVNPIISSLDLLEFLDLSDNDIKGSIPTEIGLLSNLKYLRLCYNQFVGNETNFGNNLKNLELIQVHGNRLSGEIPSLGWTLEDSSSFVSDCGVPTAFDDALRCEDCTMCCNIQGDCYPQEETDVQSWGFENFTSFTWVVLAVVFSVSCITATASLVWDKVRQQDMSPTESTRQLQKREHDAQFAIEIIGEDSVYQFFLGKNILAWIISFATVIAQGWMLFIFVVGSEIDLQDDRSDLVYTWFCPRDNDECRDLGDLTPEGWLAFVILMFVHVSKDIIDGVKMLLLSGKTRNDIQTRVRFFVGGTVLFTISIFTLYTSTIYNLAIATSNTEIIMNSVVILFITDVDELVHDILMTINPSWVERSSHQTAEESALEGSRRDEGEEASVKENGDNETEPSGENARWGTVVQNLESKVRELEETVEMVLEQNAELKKLLITPKNTTEYC